MPLRGFAKSAASGTERKGVIKDLSILGGLNEDEHPTSLQPTDLRVARNVARKGRTTGTRPGFSMSDASYDAAITGTPFIQGIYEFRRNQDANRDLVVVGGANAYSSDTTTLDKTTNTVTITSGQNNLWTFATHQNKMFAAGGSTSDSFWYWDGTNPLGKVSLGLSSGQKYVFAKWNFVFLAGFGGTAYNDNPMVVRYCDWGTDATDANNWNVNNVIPGVILQNNFGPGSYGREFMTGLGSFQDNRGDFLLTLTNRRILTFMPNPEVEDNETAFKMGDAIDTGCVHQNAFVNLGLDVGDAIYLGPDGVHSLAMSSQYGNRATNYLSWPIRRTFDQITRSRLKYASGAYWPNEGLVLFLITVGSSTTHNILLALDIKDAAQISPDTVRWYKWDLPTSILPNILAAGRGTDDKPYIYLGDTTGRIFRCGRNVYADNGLAIPVTLETASSDLGLPQQQKTIGDTFVGLQGSGSASVRHQIVLDDGATFGSSSTLGTGAGDGIWGTGTWGASAWGVTGGVERHRISSVGTSPTVGHKFTSAGVSAPFWITSLSQEVFVSGATQDSTANTVV